MQGSGERSDGDGWRQLASYLDQDEVRWLEALAERMGISTADAVLLTTLEAQRDGVWELERGL